ncbi:signal transduction histidine kinase [Arthrobacter pigmenti]|uniref:histidine kinase n=1 Tax=Arthrobacter pigmenti TaxID=271432 RepID=A0A846RML3_9MICC|nr:histidine kinase [Arthrobacter pigmenti]NJC21065.1 signal transduction histidine kinase [Arthrobacter pigmenti]
MERSLNHLRRWGAPAFAVVFFILWCIAEAGRMGGSFTAWSGALPLVLMTFAIALSVWVPYASMAITAALLLGQLFHLIPPPYSNHWAIYLGAFIALGFTLWVSNRRTRLIAVGLNVVFAALMTVLMLSWRYGGGVGWFPDLGYGDSVTFSQFGWQLFALLLLIAGGCAAVGLLLALFLERESLFQARATAQRGLHKAEVNLVVEQERSRISRDLHDVLAHSLTVISAQADGIRYLNKGLPASVTEALESIARSARSALLDAQRVIEGGENDDDARPQPQLNDLESLVEEMRNGGLRIEFGESGERRDLTDGQQVAIYRIVQESLTNALKHGGRDTDVRLHLDWSGPGLTVHVASTIAETDAAAEPEADRVGRGLPGMRERAHLAGGWVTAGPDGEHFRVTAYIPYPKQEQSVDDGASSDND